MITCSPSTGNVGYTMKFVILWETFFLISKFDDTIFAPYQMTKCIIPHNATFPYLFLPYILVTLFWCPDPPCIQENPQVLLQLWESVKYILRPLRHVFRLFQLIFSHAHLLSSSLTQKPFRFIDKRIPIHMFNKQFQIVSEGISLISILSGKFRKIPHRKSKFRNHYSSKTIRLDVL